MVSSLCVRNEDNKALNSGYAFAAPADFLDVHFVFLALFYWLRTKVGWTSVLIAESSRISVIVSQFLPSFLILGPSSKES
jgi:hypothetical protein